MSKTIFTTDNLPQGSVVKSVFDMIQFTGVVEVSKKGLIRNVLEKNRNEYQEVLDSFVACAPEESNAILGTQVSTSTQSFNNGTFLHVTYIGNPAILELES